MSTSRAANLQFAADHVLMILDEVKPNLVSDIAFTTITKHSIQNFSEWDRHRFCIMTGDERFLIYGGDEGHLLYSVNVTGDSVLTATEELMDLVARKF